MNSKQPSSYSQTDQNWHWPERTWFRERLQAVKSQQEQRRKPLVSPPSATPAKPGEQPESGELKID